MDSKDSTSSKACFKCGQVLPLSFFYKHKQMADGHLGKCKECTKKDSIKCRNNNIEYYRLFDRKRGNRMTAEQRKVQNKKNRNKPIAWRKKYPERYFAHNELNKALKRGDIVKPDKCIGCLEVSRLHGHHDDYSKPLDVLWMCIQHHRDLHNNKLDIMEII